MAHRIDMGAWKQHCDERIKKLKHDEEMKKRKAKEVPIPAEQEKCHGAKEILDPDLCKAIRDKGVQLFVSILETLCSEKLCVSEIMGQATRSGNTVLHLATYADSGEIVEVIAGHYPELLTRRSIKGDTVLHVAARTQKSNLIETILDCSAKHSSTDREELCKMDDKYGNTAMHYAVMMGDLDGVFLLFSADEEVVHYLNKEGNSPLYLAVESGEIDIIEVLLEASFQNVVWCQGNSPLHAAILGGNQWRRANFAAKTKNDSHIPRRLAVGTFKEEAQSAKPRAGPCQHCPRPIEATRSSLRPSFPPSTSPTPCIPSTVCAQHLLFSIEELVELLLKRIPKLISSRDQKGHSPLHWAASIGHLKSVEILLREDRLSTLEWNTKGHLPVHVACKRGHVEVVKKIAEQEWLDSKDLLNKRGQNMLHIAAKNGKDKVVSYILRNKKRFGELLNERDENGNTPLHLASKYLHPKVLLLFTKERTVDVNLVNNEGLTAPDIVLQQREVSMTVRQLLASTILHSAGATLSEKGMRIKKHQDTQPPQMKWLKDRINTLMLVATLVATVSFAAGFTMPGGYNSSDDSDSNRRGMATLLNRKMFQLYTICDVVAMYSSAIGSFILLWAQLGDFYVASSVVSLALYLVGLALFTMSIAFMAAVHLVVSNRSWLAIAVMIISIIFLSVFFVAFVLLIYPLRARNFLLRQILYLVLKIMIPFSGSSRKLSNKKKNKMQEELSERDKDMDAPPQKESIDMPEKQQTS